MSPITHCNFVQSVQLLKWSLHLYLHFALGFLYPSDLDVLVEELSPLHNRWEELAHVLSLSLDLETTRAHSHSGDELHETLRRWLDTGGTWWGEVISALRMVGEDDAANKLKVKYGELATTVVSLTLLACGSMGNCGVELIWLGRV